MHRLAVYACNNAPENDRCMPGAVALQSDLSDNRAVVRYAERPYTTCSFQVMCVNMHKWLIRKRLQCMFGAITHQLYLICSSYTKNRYLQQWSSHLICRMSVYNLQFFSYECKYTQNVLKSGCNPYLEPYLSDYISHTARKYISNCRAVIPQVECPYMTFNLHAMYVCTHKMAYWKETVVCIWSHITRQSQLSCSSYPEKANL